MTTKYQAVLDEFKDATQRLAEALAAEKTEFVRDAAIKRFEMAFDLSWKTIKSALEEEGILCASPLACIKEAFRQHLVGSHDAWVELIRTRNKTVHTYDEELAEEVYTALPAALSAFQELLAELAKRAAHE